MVKYYYSPYLINNVLTNSCTIKLQPLEFICSAEETGWVKAALLASVSCAEKEKKHQHITCQIDIFMHVAPKAGLLPRRKEMDAASAAAMWEESNCLWRAQRIILRHLRAFFGRRITVPELEESWSWVHCFLFVVQLTSEAMRFFSGILKMQLFIL